MKPVYLLLLALGFAALGVWAQNGAPAADRKSVKVIETATPVFPYKLTELGYSTGEVRIVLGIDEAGKLTDWLVIAYTHRKFADEALVAIRKWQFEPARIQGRPVAAQLEVTISFESSGAIVTYNDMGTYLQRLDSARLSSTEAYQPCSLQEIDRIPTPLNAVTPVYPTDLAKRGLKGAVTVEFFIDETGRVRMPAILRADYDELAPLAVEALQQWRFEPPTRKGQPVLVRAKQVFHFGPAKN
jgi:TonB family protein